RISWNSLPNSDIENNGKVEFQEVPEGTKMTVLIAYLPKTGDLGQKITTVLNPIFKQQVRRDIRRFRNLIETEAEVV
ncbi:MAG: cyclase/dehydrase, partial [Bacteroidota bacterium]